MQENMQMISNNPDELFFKADALLKEGKISEGKALFEKAVDIDPTHGRSYNHLGWLYETKFKDFAKAEEYYKLALEHAPEYPAGWMNYAYLLSTLKRYDDLSAHLDRAEQVPGISLGRLAAERAYMLETQGKFDEAVEMIKKALMQTYSDQDVEQYQKDIERIRRKEEIINQ